MREKIIEILRQVNEDILGYKGKNMVEDGIIDSLEIMEIVAAAESEFHIEMEADDIVPENFADIEAIIQLIEKKLG